MRRVQLYSLAVFEENWGDCHIALLKELLWLFGIDDDTHQMRKRVDRTQAVEILKVFDVCSDLRFEVSLTLIMLHFIIYKTVDLLTRMVKNKWIMLMIWWRKWGSLKASLQPSLLFQCFLGCLLQAKVSCCGPWRPHDWWARLGHQRE